MRRLTRDATMEGMDPRDLKIMALQQSVAEANNQIIDLRVELTLLAQRLQEAENREVESAEEEPKADEDS